MVLAWLKNDFEKSVEFGISRLKADHQKVCTFPHPHFCPYCQKALISSFSLISTEVPKLGLCPPEAVTIISGLGFPGSGQKRAVSLSNFMSFPSGLHGMQESSILVFFKTMMSKNINPNTVVIILYEVQLLDKVTIIKKIKTRGMSTFGC